MMQTDGYLQAAVFEGDSVVAVAGYRFMEMLFSGKSLVDDLNTDETRRSRGHGKLLMDWLKREAKERGCVQLQLDSGVQRRADAPLLLSRKATIKLPLPDRSVESGDFFRSDFRFRLRINRWT